MALGILGTTASYGTSFSLFKADGATESIKQAGPTLIQGDLENSVWTLEGSPYIVTGRLSIPESDELTIEPGVVIKFMPWDTENHPRLDVFGTLTAIGTEENPIVFTSYKDDSYGGDSNEDGDSSQPAPGDWTKIYFANDSEGIIEHAIIQYGGFKDNIKDSRSLVFLSNSSPTIRNNVLRHCTHAGVRVAGTGSFPAITFNQVEHISAAGIHVVEGASPLLAKNTLTANSTGILIEKATAYVAENEFINNVEYAVLLDDGGLSPSLGNSGTGNGLDGIAIRGILHGSQRWQANNNFPYVITDLVTVASTDFLNIDPGVVIKVVKQDTDISPNEARLDIRGSLNAIGSELEPIIFTSFNDDTYGGDTNKDGSATIPEPGDWSKIHIDGGSGNLEYIHVLYGGQHIDTAGPASLVYINNGSPTISNSYFTRSAGGAILVGNPEANAIIDNNQIELNGSYGIFVYLEATAAITNNSLVSNSTGIHIASHFNTVTGNTFTGQIGNALLLENASAAEVMDNTGTENAINGIAIWGTLPSDDQWHPNPDFPFVVDNQLHVLTGRTLTIEPGTIVKFREYGLIPTVLPRLNIIGALEAIGTEENPIVFTSLYDDEHGGDTDNASNTPSAGDWSKIYFNGGTGKIEQAIIQYGGHSDDIEHSESQVYIDNATPQIVGTSIQYGSGAGIKAINGSYPLMVNNQVKHQTGTGIHVENANAVLRGNTVTSNSMDGITINGNSEIELGTEGQPGLNTLWDNGTVDIANHTPNTIQAIGNYWGPTQTGSIDERIHDDDENASLGAVLYEPIYTGEPPPHLYTDGLFISESLIRPEDPSVLGLSFGFHTFDDPDGGWLIVDQQRKLAPNNCFAGTALTPDGVEITPEVSAAQYWTIMDIGLSDYEFDVRFSHTNLVETIDHAYRLVFINRFSESLCWTPLNTTLANDILTSSRMTEFGQFGIGSRQTDNQLPVELVSFDLTANGDAVTLSWSTASEVNNAGFEIQHKLNGEFQKVGFVAGHGTTTTFSEYQFALQGLDPGNHSFRLKQIDFDGQFEYSETLEAIISLNESIHLTHVYPNPFNPRTTFKLAIPQEQHVSILVYNSLGQRVSVLHEGIMEANTTHTFRFGASHLPSGMYIIRIEGKSFSSNRKAILLK